MNAPIDFLSPATTQFLLALVTAAIMVYVAVRATNGRSNKLSHNKTIFALRGCYVVALLALLLNPVRVTERPGSIDPSNVFFLLDASESMAVGNEGQTRWDQAVNQIRMASAAAHDKCAADVSLFRFGRKLKAIASPKELGLEDRLLDDGSGITFGRKAVAEDGAGPDSTASVSVALANEPDTQLLVALRQISSRFGRKPPSAIVVFSDGRTRDAARMEEVAEHFARLGVPVHAVPLGSTDSGGDVSLLSLLVPATARKQSEVQAHVFLRSYGYDGQRTEVRLDAVDDDGKLLRRLTSAPVTLRSGFQSLPLAFRTDTATRKLRALVAEQPNEVSTDNNRFQAEMHISREKIRVLYLEGNLTRAVQMQVQGRMVMGTPGSSLQSALQEDVDIECVMVPVSPGRPGALTSAYSSLPMSSAELAAFDAVILSDVPRSALSNEQLEGMEWWVRQRGGGLCMAGGQNSFGSGQWNHSPLDKALPVTLSEGDWNPSVDVAFEMDRRGTLHPLLKITDDEALNQGLLANFPRVQGANVKLLPKPNLTQVLAVGVPPDFQNSPESRAPSALFSPPSARPTFNGETEANGATEVHGDPRSEFPVITVGQYGKGRTLALAMPISGPAAQVFQRWGRREGQNQYYSQFWRNVAYWLTEQAFIGRRRLIASADKRYYGPGETIALSAEAFDERANETSSYRLVGVIEPQSFDNIESDYSIVRWPNNVPRTKSSDSPLMMWGEEFEIPAKTIGGRARYQIDFAIAETLPSGMSSQSLRLELTAYEGLTQVDSTTVPIQILHAPFEQQNPFPDHELLARLAEKSGGRVLKDEHALTEMLTSLPVTRGPPEFRKAPIWSRWWALVLLLALVSSEWCYRRWIGLA